MSPSMLLCQAMTSSHIVLDILLATESQANWHLLVMDGDRQPETLFYSMQTDLRSKQV